MKPPNDQTVLRNFPWVVVRFRCHYCQRQSDARLASLAWHYGVHTTLRQLVETFMSPCPWDPHNPARKPQKYGMKCGAYCPDIGRTSPPNWPPAMMGLTLVEGGKGDSSRRRLQRPRDAAVSEAIEAGEDISVVA